MKKNQSRSKQIQRRITRKETLEMEIYYINDELLIEKMKKQEYLNNKKLISKEKKKRIKYALIQTAMFFPTIAINPIYISMFLIGLAYLQKFIYDKNTEKLKKATKKYDKGMNEEMVKYLEETRVKTKEELNFTIKMLNILLDEEKKENTRTVNEIDTNTKEKDDKIKTLKK